MTLRRSRVRAKRATPRRREAPRWTADDWEAATPTLLARDHGRCPVCGQLITDRAERHHRQRRAVGGDRYANLLLLHGGPNGCHQWITEHPEAAQEAGWIVSAYAEDPANVPMRKGQTWWLLDDQGGATPAPSPAVEAGSPDRR